MSADATVYDVAGVGLGPFNLGLAALLDGVPDIDAVFFEAKHDVTWHPGLMIPGATLQVPYLADLVTLADPTSPHSFLNYLHEHGRLYRFYFRESSHPARREYEDYLRWVAGRLASCRFGAPVQEVRQGAGGLWELVVGGTVHRARAVVLGVGSAPVLPPCAEAQVGDDVLHSGDYRDRREALLACDAVTVVGSGQSAAEVFADLLDHGRPDAKLDWLTRSSGFFPMEYSKLGLEHFSPEYTRYFHGLSAERRDALRSGQDLLYKGIDATTSARIYDALYERSIDGDPEGVTYAAGCELIAVERLAGGGLALTFAHHDQDTRFEVQTSAVVLATGYGQAPLPVPDLDRLAERDEHGHLRVGLDYGVALTDPDAGPIFVQNAEQGTHGVGTPDLGLGAYRNARIVNALCGREVYAVRERNVFQRFGAPAEVPA